MAYTKLKPITHEDWIVKTEKKLANARNNNKPRMIAIFERRLAELKTKK